MIVLATFCVVATLRASQEGDSGNR